MSEWIDHFASAEDSNQFAMQEPHLRSWRFHRKSLIHAVLALEEQLRVANLIALGRLQIASGLDGIGDVVGDGSAFRALYPEGPNTPLAPDIARALRIGDGNE